jgi:hypothetical protein
MSAFYCTQNVTEACFIVRDHNGQALAYVYFEEEPGKMPGVSSTVVLNYSHGERGSHRSA